MDYSLATPLAWTGRQDLCHLQALLAPCKPLHEVHTERCLWPWFWTLLCKADFAMVHMMRCCDQCIRGSKMQRYLSAVISGELAALVCRAASEMQSIVDYFSSVLQYLLPGM